KTKGSRQRHVRGRKRGRAGCAGRFPSATAKGGGLCRGRGGRGQSPVRLGRQAGHVDRGRDVAVSPLRRRRGRVAVHRLPHHRHPAAALRARRLRADAELRFVPALGAVSRSYPLVGYRRRHHGRGDPRLRHRRRRGIHRPRDHADPPRRRARGRLHHLVARGDAANHRLDRSMRCVVVHGLCHRRPLSAAAVDAPRIRHFATRRPPVHHARRDFRHSRRRVLLADHPVHDLRRVPATLRRRQILHRLFDGAHGPQGQQRRPHGGVVILSARGAVGLGRRHHGDDRRRRLSFDAKGGFREERGRRPARGGRPPRPLLPPPPPPPPPPHPAPLLMAEFLKISYLDVIWMATIPTCLYYLSLLFMVELDAKRFGAHTVDFRQELTLWEMTRRYGFHFVSLVSIIIFMLWGYSP